MMLQKFYRIITNIYNSIVTVFNRPFGAYIHRKNITLFYSTPYGVEYLFFGSVAINIRPKGSGKDRT
jgi:hypothetical protein